jgi:hypothetical protein
MFAKMLIGVPAARAWPSDVKHQLTPVERPPRLAYEDAFSQKHLTLHPAVGRLGEGVDNACRRHSKVC